MSFFMRVSLCSLLLATAAGAVPTTVSYAGFLTEDGAPVNGTVELVVELYPSASGGTALFVESFSGLVVPDGDLVVELGLQEPLDDTLLNEPALFVQLAVDGQVLLPRGRLSSVPYALRAQDAETLTGVSAADISDQVQTLQGQIDALLTQVNALQANLNALASAGGPSVAFANVTGLAFSGGLSFAGGQAVIAPGGVNGTHIATNAVSSAHIAPDTITAADIGIGAVTTSEILDGTIGTADIAPGATSTLFVRNPACSSDTNVYSASPGTCTTASCSGFPCVTPPCFFGCASTVDAPILCQDAAAGVVCPAVQIRVLRN